MRDGPASRWNGSPRRPTRSTSRSAGRCCQGTLAMREAARVFTEIYDKNVWGFGSGHGSSLEVTSGYRQLITNFITHNAVRTVVDYGCGDWNFSRAIDWAGSH